MHTTGMLSCNICNPFKAHEYIPLAIFCRRNHTKSSTMETVDLEAKSITANVCDTVLLFQLLIPMILKVFNRFTIYDTRYKLNKFFN